MTLLLTLGSPEIKSILWLINNYSSIFHSQLNTDNLGNFKKLYFKFQTLTPLNQKHSFKSNKLTGIYFLKTTQINTIIFTSIKANKMFFYLTTQLTSCSILCSRSFQYVSASTNSFSFSARTFSEDMLGSRSTYWKYNRHFKFITFSA